MDHELTALQALSLWQSGEIPGHYTLWGHHLYFWGRLGRTLEITSAFAVLIDLMGAERLAVLAKELRQWHQDPATRAVNIVRRPRVAVIGVLAIAALASIAILTGTQTLDAALPFTAIAVPSVMAFVVKVLSMGIGAYLMLALYFVLFELVSAPLTEATARFMQRQHADTWLKLVTLPVLTLGFFLDLLGS